MPKTQRKRRRRRRRTRKTRRRRGGAPDECKGTRLGDDAHVFATTSQENRCIEGCSASGFNGHATIPARPGSEYNYPKTFEIVPKPAPALGGYCIRYDDGASKGHFEAWSNEKCFEPPTRCSADGVSKEAAWVWDAGGHGGGKTKRQRRKKRRRRTRKRRRRTRKRRRRRKRH
jgi:hypothetical protein